MLLKFLLLVSASGLVAAQRPFYAGNRPIGFPSFAAASDELGNRFGDGNVTSSNITTSNVTTSTQRLPVEARGDKDLVDRLSKLPKDNQPFWLLNWQALEEQRKNPQSYPQRPSQFAAPLNLNNVNGPTTNPSTSNVFTSRPVITNARFNTQFNSNRFPTTPNIANDDIGFVPLNNNPVNSIPESNIASGLGDRFGDFDSNFDSSRVTTQVTTKRVPTRVDDVLGNNYNGNQNSNSGRSLKGNRQSGFISKPFNSRIGNPINTKFSDDYV